MPIMNLLPELVRSGLYVQAVDLVLLLLRQMGWELEISRTRFRVVRWGFMIDEIVMALVDLCDAYRVVRPRLVADVEVVANQCYLILCGEVVTWEKEYGRGGRYEVEKGKELKAGGEGRVEDLVVGVGGLKFV